MKCEKCGASMDEEQAAEDHDAGVPDWNICDRCSNADYNRHGANGNNVDTGNEKRST